MYTAVSFGLFVFVSLALLFQCITISEHVKQDIEKKFVVNDRLIDDSRLQYGRCNGLVCDVEWLAGERHHEIGGFLVCIKLMLRHEVSFQVSDEDYSLVSRPEGLIVHHHVVVLTQYLALGISHGNIPVIGFAHKKSVAAAPGFASCTR